MSSRQSFVRRDGPPRRRRQLVIKEKNISSDEFMAASIGDVEWLDQSLRDGRDPSTFDKNGLAPVHLAALHGRLNCLQLLIEKYDVDVNLSSSTGWNPLHLCINRESGSRAFRCMNYLLDRNADVDCQNDDNVTPVHQSASEGLTDCLKKLLEHKVCLSVSDVRGHLPLDLARLWGHKSCARLIRTEMWKREKEDKAEEIKQLHVVKKYYTNLQKEAVHQLRNEQEFYGGIAFGNWLADKGLPENLKEIGTFPRERYPDAATNGLSKRLRQSGGLDDCAQRMEKTTSRQGQKSILQTSKPSGTASLTKPNSKVAKVKVESQVIKPESVSKKSFRPKRVEKVEKVAEGDGYVQQDVWDRNKEFTPFSEASRVTDQPSRRAQWNYSTNLNRVPITDIKYKDTVSLSIHPDEPDNVLPKRANLSVKLDMGKNPKIRMTMPGGRIQSADVRMPHLPSSIIGEVLSGMSSDRIRIPQEFKAIHVYDLKKKRQPENKPKAEVGMHLSILGDPRILRKSTSSFDSDPQSLSKTFSSSDDHFPLITVNSNRMLDTLHRICPPKAFLA